MFWKTHQKSINKIFLPNISTKSVIIPVHNAGQWLDDCLASISLQQHTLNVEVSLFLDSCTDDSERIVQGWSTRLIEQGYAVITTVEENENPKGG